MEHIFPLLPLNRHLLPLTLLNRYLTMGSDEKLSNTYHTWECIECQIWSICESHATFGFRRDLSDTVNSPKVI